MNDMESSVTLPLKREGGDETWTSGSHEVSQTDQAKRACLR
jgi:hypothetical protein